jgi:formate hydrogenlyase subunit 3/multisubunit Na+/H+ antiporter MnhD subunit
MNMNVVLLLLATVFPFILAIGLMTGLLRKMAFALAPWAALPALILAFTHTKGTEFKLPWLLFGAHMGFDEPARIFLFFTSFLWLIAGIYSISYFSDPLVRKRFFIWFLLAMTGNIGLILAQDLALFYTFFALMSFASYGLVVHEGTQDAVRAGRIYIILVVIGEILLFIAFSLASQTSPSIEFQEVRPSIAASEMHNWIIGLTLLGFGIKAGVIGLHIWLPLAHPVAPTPASAVLSGAMIAAGLLGWLRILPLGEVTFKGWGEIMIIAGMLSVYYAVFIGLFQNKAKTVLAYSSISKMGILTMAVGLGFLAPESWPLVLTAILIFVLHHGLVKGSLFLGVGLATLPPASKIQRQLLIAGLILLALSLAGAPFTSGMIAKQFFKAPMELITSPLLDWINVLFTLSAIATTLLMARFLYLVWPQREHNLEHTNNDARQYLTMWCSWLLLIIVVLLIPVFIPLIPLSGELVFWSTPIVISALWPVIVGAVIAALIGLTLTRRRKRLPFNVPPGDVLIIIEKVFFPILVSILSLVVKAFSKINSLFRAFWSNYSEGKFFAVILDYCEKQLGRWTVALTLFLLAGGISVFLLIS